MCRLIVLVVSSIKRFAGVGAFSGQRLVPIGVALILPLVFAWSGAVAAGNALSALEQAGRRIYLDGVTGSGEPLRALVGAGQMPLRGAVVACGNCHGPDGKGRPESSVIPPEITWEALTKPYGHIHATRKHGPFDVSAFAFAVNEGIDPAGNVLDFTMPRFALSRSDVEALVAYLKRLSSVRDPGIVEQGLRIGTVLPDSGPAAAAGRAVEQVLNAYFEYVNRNGGVHQRRLELVIAVSPDDARKRFDDKPVFALVSPFGGAPDDAVSKLLTDSGLPTVGPLTPVPDATGGPLALAFYLQPGLGEQLAALVDFAASRVAGERLDAAVLSLGAQPYQEAAWTAVNRCEKHGCARAEQMTWMQGSFDAAALVKQLGSAGVEHIFFAGPGTDLAALVAALDKLPDNAEAISLYVPGAIARAAIAGRQAMPGELFVAYPAQPAAGPAASPELWEALERSGTLSRQHRAVQLAALQAAAVLVEALRRSGRDLSREALVRALEGLGRFETGFGPPVSFGPGQRIGARGSYVVAIDRDGRFSLASDWIQLN
ncbi:MAG: ABC transporter substrate-binding protein [Betaproteobacteria bacterium]|nr:MAG: ABC transporter substrate-binding protein [Betaproteobacteria bacterium]